MCRGSDLAASGAGSGFVHLMAVEAGAIRPLFKLPLVIYSFSSVVLIHRLFLVQVVISQCFFYYVTDWICELYGFCKIR